jgi:multiple sugar transport system ATP-binding protein
MGFLDIDNVTKSYGAVEVLHRVDIEVEEGSSSSSSAPPAAGSRRFST